MELSDWPGLEQPQHAEALVINWALHIAPSITIEQKEPHRWLVTYRGSHIAQLETTLSYTPHHDVVSPMYGITQESTTLRATTSLCKTQHMVIIFS